MRIRENEMDQSSERTLNDIQVQRLTRNSAILSARIQK